ncbi:MAG TPA: hypothetical protein VK174_06015 [Chitinophagales bacterium]|nr:hypothetical protein [Chitinophagales bacterium]
MKAKKKDTQKYKKVPPPKKILSTKEKAKNVLYFLGILLIGFSAIYCLSNISLWVDNRQIKKIEENLAITAGEIIKVGNMKGNYAIAEYYVNNKRYVREDEPPSRYIFPGERYEIIYDSLNPVDSRIDYAKPLFVENQQTFFVYGEVDKFTRSNNVCFFKYRVNNKQYQRCQKLPESKFVKEGSSYKIEYLVSNPNIAILIY